MLLTRITRPILPTAGWPLPWPLPALLAWAGGWAGWLALVAAGAAPGWALLMGVASGAALAWPCRGAWRRALAAGGFPLSAAVLGPAAAWPAWAWLVLLLPLLVLYPLRAWRDAPFFPTPATALDGLDGVVGSPPPRRVLDAGCGLGHGLAALRRLWPHAQLEGVEWSPVLRLGALLRCRYARVMRGDMWAGDWIGLDLVYLFQRPESMARAWHKAMTEMRPGTWLVSLEFAVPGQSPVACLQGPGRRPVWVYRLPPQDSA
jgi:SAM-dependent methyltransferase